MSTLLPCPFCGSTEVSVSHTVQGSCWWSAAAVWGHRPDAADPAEAAGLEYAGPGRGR
jgi:hypothetical protein